MIELIGQMTVCTKDLRSLFVCPNLCIVFWKWRVCKMFHGSKNRRIQSVLSSRKQTVVWKKEEKNCCFVVLKLLCCCCLLSFDFFFGRALGFGRAPGLSFTKNYHVELCRWRIEEWPDRSSRPSSRLVGRDEVWSGNDATAIWHQKSCRRMTSRVFT